MGSFPTQFKVLSEQTDIPAHKTDILIVPVFQKQGEDAKPAVKGKSTAKNKAEDKDTPSLQWENYHKVLDKALNGHFMAALKAEKFSGGCGKTRIFHARKDDTLQARWVVVLGLGCAEKLDVKKATQAFVSALKDTFGFDKMQTATILLPGSTKKLSKVQCAQSAIFASLQATYKTKEAGEKKIHKLQHVQLILPKGQSLSAKDVTVARTMALAEAFTKDLANKPANTKTAETLADAARSMADIPGVKVDVVSDVKKIQKEMPAFWAVAQGSAKSDPPRFIKVTYKPPSTTKIKKKIALVGKGVIFDTGGVQVKTGTYMNDMKFDMTGAATVLSVIRAAAELGLKGIQISAYVAATKNAIGEGAYLPDSIIDSSSGKKIEIRHTDAEGRLTLADAVYKAVEDKADEIVTVATLTGAAGVAVGNCIALMGTDDAMLNRIEQTAKAVGETIQKLELLEEDFNNVKSDRDAADLCNTSKSKQRGHMSAGAFVISFAKDVNIAHLDIAGGDAKDGNASGIAVKGLIEYLRNEAS